MEKSGKVILTWYNNTRTEYRDVYQFSMYSYKGGNRFITINFETECYRKTELKNVEVTTYD